jgi:hypothetical protein
MDAVLGHGRHVSKRAEIGHIGFAKHIGLIRQQNDIRTQRRHLFKCNTRIAAIAFGIARTHPFGLLTEVGGERKATVAIGKNVLSATNAQHIVDIGARIDRHIRVFPDWTKHPYRRPGRGQSLRFSIYVFNRLQRWCDCLLAR